MAFIPVFLQAQEIRIKAYTDTSRILIGDQLRYTLEVRQPENTAVAFPALSDTLAQGVEIVSSLPADTTRAGEEGIRVRKEYLITAFDTGRYEISPLAFTWKENGSIQTGYTNYVYLEAGRAGITPADSTEFFDIKTPYSAPVSFREILPWLLVILFLAVAGVLGNRYFRSRRKGKAAFVPVKPAEPPWQIAFREMEELKKEKLWQQGKTKEYYTRLTDILRRYIYGMYGIHSPERTSNETMELLREKDHVPVVLMERLEYVLQTSDMVKFARAEPKPSENDQVFGEAYDFILESQRYRKQQEREEQEARTDEKKNTREGGAS